jgi:hypothetical protein
MAPGLYVSSRPLRDYRSKLSGNGSCPEGLVPATGLTGDGPPVTPVAWGGARVLLAVSWVFGAGEICPWVNAGMGNICTRVTFGPTDISLYWPIY